MHYKWHKMTNAKNSNQLNLLPFFRKKAQKLLASCNKRLGNDAKDEQLLTITNLLAVSQKKQALAENNLDDMRKKYKVLAEQYLADQERWNAIEERLKTISQKVARCESEQGDATSKKASSRSAQKNKKK